MEIYRLRHKPTGAYFNPSGRLGNLSPKGKIYVSKPSIKWTENIRIRFRYKNKYSDLDKKIIDYFGLDSSQRYIDVYRITNPEDWQIEIVE